MSINFYPDGGASEVAFDLLAEAGYRLQIYSHGEALHLWVVSIRGKVKASCRKDRGLDVLHWAFGFSGSTAWVNTMTTEGLFAEVEKELNYQVPMHNLTSRLEERAPRGDSSYRLSVPGEPWQSYLERLRNTQMLETIQMVRSWNELLQETAIRNLEHAEAQMQGDGPAVDYRSKP